MFGFENATFCVFGHCFHLIYIMQTAEYDYLPQIESGVSFCTGGGVWKQKASFNQSGARYILKKRNGVLRVSSGVSQFWGLSCSVVWWQWTLLYLLSGVSRVSRLWLCVLSFSVSWALCRYLSEM